jgi:shikimate dehydrogenase
LLNFAKLKGAKIMNGMDMLAYQGAESFSIWENVPPPYEIMKKELRNA